MDKDRKAWRSGRNFWQRGWISGNHSCIRVRETNAGFVYRVHGGTEAIIQPAKLESLKGALAQLGIQGMTILEARGHGRQEGHTDVYRGREYEVDLLPKIKVELVVPDETTESAIGTIVDSTSTWKIGDGKIVISKIAEAVKIRNKERGVSAL